MTETQALEILWDYLCLHQTPEKADLILGFGCYDSQVAHRAAELYLAGFAPRILFTGGLGRNTTGLFCRGEAEVFAQVAMDRGVPKEAILLETKSANTKENIQFSRQLLQQENIPHARILGVHKPYMERRIQAAMGVYWPEQAFSVTSAQVTAREALALAARQGMTEKEVISTIVGDFQRIELYAQKGYQLPQYIPPVCWEAFRLLVDLGYDSQLAK